MPAALPTHRPVDFGLSVEDLMAKVWATKVPKPPSVNRAIGPPLCDEEMMAQLEANLRKERDCRMRSTSNL